MGAAIFDEQLCSTEYFRVLQDAYDKYFAEGLINRFRCAPVILQKLQHIYEYNPQHGKYFARRLKQQQADFRSCEAVVTEIIVYSYYLPFVKDGTIKSLNRKEDDYDLRIVREGHPDAFLEIFCLMPIFAKDEHGVYDVLSHTQEAMSSVRQKLLAKMREQQQMQQERENWAVIDLNDYTIAGPFTVPASLSSGYKIQYDLVTMKKVDSGFDWSSSIFDLTETRNLHGVIHFDLGYYEGRRYILNGRVRGDGATEAVTIP